MVNTVSNGVYYNNYGDAIPFGSLIHLEFAGAPTNLTRPYQLISAENKFTTVNYRNEVELLIEGANGVRDTFYFARYYSPKAA